MEKDLSTKQNVYNIDFDWSAIGYTVVTIAAIACGTYLLCHDVEYGWGWCYAGAFFAGVNIRD